MQEGFCHGARVRLGRQSGVRRGGGVGPEREGRVRDGASTTMHILEIMSIN